MVTRWLVVMGSVGLVTSGCNCNQPHAGDAGPGLTLDLSISGEGHVDVDGAAACTPPITPCSLTVTPGTTVEAVPAAGSELTQWSCDGTVSTVPILALSTSGTMHCTVLFSKVRVPLEVVVNDDHGGEGGVVTSSVGGIDCGGGGTECSATFEPGTSVTLTAVPGALYVFSGWEGDCAGAASTVAVTLRGPISCVARFVHLTFPLTLSVVGQGTLAVESNGGTVGSCDQLSCAPLEVDQQGVMTLVATPAANDRLLSWSGDCVGTALTPSTTLTMEGPRSCAVTFGLVDRSLSLSTSGTGQGLVTTDPTGPSYTHGTVVRLTALPDGNSDFSGWQGDCSGSSAVLDVTLDADKHCTALFSLKLRTLTVTSSAHGSVTSVPPGIDTTSGKMSAAYPHGTFVSLAALPDAHYEAVFSGACLGVGNSSSVTMDADKSCGVTFRLVKPTLTVTPVGSGSIVSTPAGIDTKTGKLAASFDYGTTVTLTATPNVDGQQISFVGWSGDCGGTNQTVVLLFNGNKSCTATFTVTPYDLAVTVAPPASGSVTGTIVGGSGTIITCGGGGTDCGEPRIPSDKTVSLVATPAAGYRFDRWSNCSTDTSATLSVPMSNTKTCAASFLKQWSVTVSSVTGPGTVTIDRSSSGVGIDRTCSTGACSQLVDSNETVTITAVPANSAAIVEAFTCSAGTTTGNSSTLLVNSTADVTCAATFHQQYTVSVAVSGAGGTVTSTPSLITCASTGGSCSAFFLSGASVVLTATPNANMQAAWSTTTGGACDGTPSNTGQVKLMTFSSLNSAKACTATFSTIPVTVSGRAGAHGTVTPATATIISGGAGATLTATAAANYHVSGWASGLSAGSGTATGCSGNGTSVTVSVTNATPGSTYDCTATFAINAVTVNGKAGPNGAVNPVITVTTSGGASAVLTATPATNFHVSGWSGTFTAGSGTATGCSGTGTGISVSISGATDGAVYDCTATFAVNAVTVRGFAGANGAVTPASTATTSGGTSVGLTATPATNFHVSGWSGTFTTGSGTATGCSGTGTGISVSISGATDGAVYDCTATFAVNGVTVRGFAGANGAVTPASTATTSGGASVGLTATPATNFHVSGWSGTFTTGSGTATGCSGTGTTVTVSLSGATDGAVYDCTATFAVNTVTIRGFAGANGAVTPASTSTTSGGTSVGLTATPATNFHISGWSGTFTTGSGTATGCSGTGATVTVSISGATDGAVYDCTATFAVNTVTIRGFAGANGTVTPASTATTSGGTSVGLTATPATNFHVSGWSGTFTTGSGTPTGCSGASTSVTVSITGASDGAVYDCTAAFAVNTVTVNGSSGANGTVAPPSTVVSSGGSGAALTATPAPSYRVLSWSGAFSSGSGTATGCTGASATVTVSITGATDGAVYDCTATFQQQSTLTVRVVPAPSRASSFGLVSSPCLIASGSGSCSAVVDTGAVVTLSTVEATNGLNQNISRFVKWACSNGATSTARATTTTVAANTTCVAQFYGLWSRYSTYSQLDDDLAPNVAALTPGVASGLPSSSSTFVLDGLDSNAVTGSALAGWVGADDEWGGPLYSDWARPQTGVLGKRIATNGDDAPSLVGLDYPSLGRYRGVLSPYLINRDTNNVVSSFARGAFTEYTYPDPPPTGATSYGYDTAFSSGRQNAAKAHALGGFRTASVTDATGPTAITQYLKAGWVVLTNAAGTPTASGLFQYPSSVIGTSCSSPYITAVNDVLWDPDTTNTGGIVAVGEYLEVSSCTVGANCPPDPTTQHTSGFIAKFGPSMNLIGMRGLASAASASAGGNFQALGIHDTLGHSGYVVFGEYADARVGVIQLSYDLGAASTPVTLAASNQPTGTGDAVTTYHDSIVDQVGNRYLVLASAAFLNATKDVVIMSLDAAFTAIASEGWRFGTATFDEVGSRITQAPEGGFLFTGGGATASQGLSSHWVTRTDESFNVPFNGSAPVARRDAPLVYGTPSSFLLGGTAFTCSAWVDGTMPTLNTVSTGHTPFVPVVDVQAP